MDFCILKFAKLLITPQKFSNFIYYFCHQFVCYNYYAFGAIKAVIQRTLCVPYETVGYIWSLAINSDRNQHSVTVPRRPKARRRCEYSLLTPDALLCPLTFDGQP